jgi:hypothetical protein
MIFLEYGHSELLRSLDNESARYFTSVGIAVMRREYSQNLTFSFNNKLLFYEQQGGNFSIEERYRIQGEPACDHKSNWKLGY